MGRLAAAAARANACAAAPAASGAHAPLLSLSVRCCSDTVPVPKGAFWPNSTHSDSELMSAASAVIAACMIMSTGSSYDARCMTE